MAAGAGVAGSVTVKRAPPALLLDVGVAGGAVLGAGALLGLDMPLPEIRLPWTVMAGGLATSLFLALAAASGPATRIMQTPPAEAVRQSA